MRISRRFQAFFALVIMAHIVVWIYARPLQAEWRNVPPAPSQFSVQAAGMGDTQLSYRLIGFMLQNIGKVGGRTESLASYDYQKLQKWFFAGYDLDPQAAFIPMLATYYYGGTSKPDQARAVAEFLEVAGNNPYKDRWRWLVHAIYLAQHKVGDLNLALKLADILGKIPNQNMPPWTRQMKAMVLNSKGDKQDAYILMKTMLETSADTMEPTEVNQTIAYICEQILTPEEATHDPVCKLKKP